MYAAFQCLLDDVLKDYRGFARPFVDDIIVSSGGATYKEAVQNHVKHLRLVLQRLREKKLVVCAIRWRCKVGVVLGQKLQLVILQTSMKLREGCCFYTGPAQGLTNITPLCLTHHVHLPLKGTSYVASKQKNFNFWWWWLF